MSENTRVVSRIKHIWEVIMCPYEDKSLAFWIKVVFGFIWAISIPNGIVYGAPDDYIISLIIMVTVLFINIMVSRFYYRTWIDAIVCIILSIPVFYVYYHASIGYFSVMFSMIFACGIVFVLGIRNSIVLNFVFLIMVIVCFRLNVAMSAKFIYGDNITLRFPYLFICFVLISYCLMYIIQRYWVEKRKRNQILEERVHDEKKKLESMSMKVIDIMSKALAAKIPREEEHCNNVAEYSRSIAQRMNLDKKSCDDAYKAGLLHEIGMIGIPDALINRVDLTDDEYEIFKTYDSAYRGDAQRGDRERGYPFDSQIQQLEKVPGGMAHQPVSAIKFNAFLLIAYRAKQSFCITLAFAQTTQREHTTTDQKPKSPTLGKISIRFQA